MASLIFASSNLHKAEEIRFLVKDCFTFKTLREAGIEIDIEEPYDTLEENALEKSRTIFNLTKVDCFSEDTGLYVKALSGEPGVRSARYSEGSRYESNLTKLLGKLAGIKNREAYFKTVVSLVIAGENHLFEGKCEGTIIASASGTSGFGYDPVFRPLGSSATFGEMSLTEKNTFSHRRKAIEKMMLFIKEHYPEIYKI